MFAFLCNNNYYIIKELILSCTHEILLRKLTTFTNSIHDKGAGFTFRRIGVVPRPLYHPCWTCGDAILASFPGSLSFSHFFRARIFTRDFACKYSRAKKVRKGEGEPGNEANAIHLELGRRRRGGGWSGIRD